MKKAYIYLLTAAMAISLFGSMLVPMAEARARYGSIRIGGYNSHGLGSHYIGGYVRTGPALRFH